MFPSLFASLTDSELWLVVPLVIVISLVYGATRHELIGPILQQAFKAGVWIVGFMSIIFVLFFVISWGL